MIHNAEHTNQNSGYTYAYPRPAVTVDVVLFAYLEQRLKTLLIRRGHEPFKGSWALPGGFVEMDEDLATAAQRELAEETNLANVTVDQLRTFGSIDRDPRGRVISVAHWAMLSHKQYADSSTRSGSDAEEAVWLDVYDLPELAFDHEIIVGHALSRLRTSVCECASGLQLLAEEFTLSEARALYETILDVELDKRNFRRRILSAGVLHETKRLRTGSHRPARLYRIARNAAKKELAPKRFPC